MRPNGAGMAAIPATGAIRAVATGGTQMNQEGNGSFWENTRSIYEVTVIA
jgi:hypothetical protein